MTKSCFLRLTTSRALISFTLFFSFSLNGCRTSSSSSAEERQAINTGNSVAKISPAPEADISIDEVMLSKPYAIIGGTVQNVGGAKLEKLSVEIELRRRDDNSLVKREVNIDPRDLAPKEKGKFSLKVFSDEWSSSRVLSLRSGARQEEIVYRTLPGAKRPPEKLPTGKDADVTPRKRPRSNSEEFLNTPDTPVKVP